MTGFITLFSTNQGTFYYRHGDTFRESELIYVPNRALF